MVRSSSFAHLWSKFIVNLKSKEFLTPHSDTQSPLRPAVHANVKLISNVLFRTDVYLLETNDFTALLLIAHRFFEIPPSRINKAVSDGDYVCFLYKKTRKTVCKIVTNHIQIYLIFHQDLIRTVHFVSFPIELDFP